LSAKGEFTYAEQKKQLGTGHAVLCAMPYLPDFVEDVIILCGDVPLMSADTILRLIKKHVDNGYDMTILAVKLDDPSGYGRIVSDEHLNIAGIVEESDATEEQKKIKTINTGVYCIKKDFLLNFLCKINSDNAQEELYLTDLVGIGYSAKKNIGTLLSRDYEEVTGVNTPVDLMRVEKIMYKKLSQVK
jgi:bifunctional N-acetylglucosamine-1-phosphate-uridyltransferase/glucosamine-1-phosphate-acetyltransferase GlmU-like protein